MQMLNIEGISKNFRGLQALKKVNIDVLPNQVLGLIGPNGSGKTTLLNVVTGFLRPTEGIVRFKGESITGLKAHEVARKGIARTFQLTSVFPNLTVAENIVRARHLRSTSSTLRSLLQTKGYRDEQAMIELKCSELMDLLEMEKKKEVLARHLAFGEQRKLEIAIALATEPELLLMDEPAAGMNPDEQKRLIRLVKLIVQQMGITVMIVEHNMRVIMGLCDSIAVLDYGVKMAEGTPLEIAHDERVISAYLGEYELG